MVRRNIALKVAWKAHGLSTQARPQHETVVVVGDRIVEHEKIVVREVCLLDTAIVKKTTVVRNRLRLMNLCNHRNLTPLRLKPMSN